MDEETAFLEAIADEPDDDGPRLVFADWLEERGDVRAELIRVQCALERLAPTDPARRALEARAAAILHRHEPLWLAKVRWSLKRPGLTVGALTVVFVASLGIYPLLGVAFFPRTDAGQFTINLKVPTGTRIEATEQYVARIEDLIRHAIDKDDFNMIVSNIGVVNDFSSLYTTNAGEYTATIQTSLQPEHRTGSQQYMERVRAEIAAKYPDVRTFFSSGSMVDAILNTGAPAPIDVQVSSRELDRTFATAQTLVARIRQLPGVGEVYIPQDMNYPALRFNVNRVHAAELGLDQREIVDNVITALNSNTMIAPNYWVDYKTGNDYFLTVQYTNQQIGSMTMEDFKQIPLHAPNNNNPTVLENVANIRTVNTPTEVDHYQLFRVIDVYVSPKSEDLGALLKQVNNIIKDTKLPPNIRIQVRGSVLAMQQSFKSFGIGLLLAIVLVYLILMAQFASFIDPFIILLAIPSGITGVILFLLITGTTLNVMSLMGLIMMTGIVVSNSILIVDVTRNYRRKGMPIRDAVTQACRVRLRPILMTSLATILGLIPMALALEAGSEQYAPLARSIIGGLTVSVIVTVLLVPAAYLLIHGREEQQQPEVQA